MLFALRRKINLSLSLSLCLCLSLSLSLPLSQAPSQSTSGIRPAPSVISRDAPVSDRLIQSTSTNLSPSSSLRETSPLRSGPSASALRVRRGVSVRCVCVTMKKSARRIASTTSNTGDTSSKQQQAQRKQKYKRKRPVSSVDHCHPYRRKKKEKQLLILHMLQPTCFGT